jgi:hypothetical protein
MTRPRMDIELARILACVGIVLFHTLHGYNAFTYGGIVVFSFLTLWLTAQSGRIELTEKAQRFLLPWAVWMVVYGAANLATHQPLFGLKTHPFTQLLAGTSVHLWYMPFAFACVAFYATTRHWWRSDLTALAAGVLGLSMICTHGWWRANSLEWLPPIGQWAHALPAMLLGVAASHSHIRQRPWAGHLFWAIACVSAGLAVEDPWFGWAYVVGLPICWWLTSQAGLPKGLQTLDLRWLSGCTAGVYFMHVLVYQLLMRLPSAVPQYLTPWLTIVASFALTWGLRRLFPRFNRLWS